MDIFTAVAEPTRRTIIEMLASQGQLSASDIYHKFPVSHPAISQHLKVLRDANLVRVEKRAQKRIYEINPDAMMEIEKWAKQMADSWEKRFKVLDSLLAEQKLTRKDKPHGRSR